MDDLIIMQGKIQKAREMLSFYSPMVYRSRGIQLLMNEFCDLKKETGEVYGKLALGSHCQACDASSHGSCCEKGMENDSTIFLLFMNLLLNVNMPEKRSHLNRCFFLGSSGCILKIRPVICVNYLCLEVREILPLEKLINLQHAQGDEIMKAFEMEEALKALFNARAGANPETAGDPISG